MSLSVITADITTLRVDAIVNAANPALLGGGGVDGAIHRAAGPGLLRACHAISEVAPGVRCPPGEARITPGFNLPADWVIHTVGPLWHGGTQGESALLAQCYRHALQLLRAHGLHSIAFPAISCGVYGYPPAAAAAVAVTTLRAALVADNSLDVTLCCFSNTMRALTEHALHADPDRC
jgi:O-acetyl-ADP-ribose deacetylase (regulator of RNase III)